MKFFEILSPLFFKGWNESWKWLHNLPMVILFLSDGTTIQVRICLTPKIPPPCHCTVLLPKVKTAKAQKWYVPVPKILLLAWFTHFWNSVIWKKLVNFKLLQHKVIKSFTQLVTFFFFLLSPHNLWLFSKTTYKITF